MKRKAGIGGTEKGVRNKDEKDASCNREYAKECPECGGKNIVVDPGTREPYCADCGTVLKENIIDLGPEWRAYNEEQKSKKARTGLPKSYRWDDKGLGTLPPKLPNLHLYTEVKAGKRVVQRSAAFCLGEIDRITSVLKLPISIKEQAAALFHRVSQKNLLKGRKLEGIASAIIYIICRENGIPRTFDEIEKVSRVDQKNINRTYKHLCRGLGLKVEPSSPIDFVPRFCTELELSINVQNKAKEIIRKATEKGLSDGYGPVGTAVGAIYIAAILEGEHRTQKEISEVTGVTEVTIRNRYQDLLSAIEPDEMDIFEDEQVQTPYSKQAFIQGRGISF